MGIFDWDLSKAGSVDNSEGNRLDEYSETIRREERLFFGRIWKDSGGGDGVRQEGGESRAEMIAPSGSPSSCTHVSMVLKTPVSDLKWSARSSGDWKHFETIKKKI